MPGQMHAAITARTSTPTRTAPGSITRAVIPPWPRTALKPPGPRFSSIREQGWHCPVHSSSTSPMRNRRSFRASRLRPETAMFRRSNSGPTRSRPTSDAITGRCSPLDQGDLALPTPARAAMVAVDPRADANDGLGYRNKWCPPLGSHPDPLDAADLRNRLEEFRDRPHDVTSIPPAYLTLH